jgi:DNA invertase Pin-like site-specific DNA recombinase
LNRIYFRVSTDKQDFLTQNNALRNLCKSKGINYDACRVYKDFDITGTTTDRKEYQNLLIDLEEYDNVLVYEFSRLWRDMEEQSRATKMFMRRNITVLSCSDGDLKPDGDTLVADIKGSVNQYEVRRLRKRTKDALAAKKAKCEAGEDTWNRRGPDKQPRKRDGYLLRWAKQRGDL